MEAKPKLTEEPVWSKLQAYFNNNGSKIKISDLFQQNPGRFESLR